VIVRLFQVEEVSQSESHRRLVNVYGQNVFIQRESHQQLRGLSLLVIKKKKKKKTPWSDSASELYRPSDRFVSDRMS
jgi:hypothetical protein